MPKVYLVASSTESLNNVKTSSFWHFISPRFSVYMEVIVNISSTITSTVEGVLKLNVAGVRKFNDASETCLDDVILVR